MVGTRPEEHLMRDVERMKTGLLFLDGMVLRNSGDTAIFLGLGFEVRNSHEVADSLLSHCGLQNAKPVATPGRRATVKEPASAVPLQGPSYSTYRTAVQCAGSDDLRSCEGPRETRVGHNNGVLVFGRTCRQDTHSQDTSVQSSLITARTAHSMRLAWLKFKTKRDLQASVCTKISVVIWCVLCLIHGCSLTRFP